LDNDFLLKLFCHFQTDNYIYLVTEYIGLDLYCLLIKSENKILKEEQAAFYTICIAHAIQTLHNHDFAFRDLKPENILINKNGYPVLCDFGLVNLLFPTHKAYTMCGTPEYFAPEIINSTYYDHKVDWWGLGILM
jgi:serine/threonine protein kinase